MSDIRAAIDMANQEFMAAFARHDARATARLYTDGGQLLPSKRDFVTGRVDIRAFWQNAFDRGFKTAVRETVELDAQDDTAIEVGRYTLFAALDSVADIGKYIVIWKHDDDIWKLHRDVWSTSMVDSAHFKRSSLDVPGNWSRREDAPESPRDHPLT